MSFNSYKFLYFLILPFLLFPIFASGSRGTLLSLIIAAIFYLLTMTGKRITKIIYIFLFVAIIFSTLSMFKIAGSERIMSFFEGNIGDNNALTRIHYYSKGLDLFLETPLIGKGTGAFGREITYTDTRLYPHNIFIEIAAENGIIGLIVLFGFIFMTCIAAFKLFYRIEQYSYNRELVQVGFCLFLFGLTASLFSGDISGNGYVWFGPAIIWGQVQLNNS